MFTKDEHNNLLTQLRSAENDADRATIISQLENDYTDVISQHTTATTDRDKAIAERDKYHLLNNDMWQQIADQKKIGANIVNNGNNTIINNEPPKKLSFADLEAQMMTEEKGRA